MALELVSQLLSLTGELSTMEINGSTNVGVNNSGEIEVNKVEVEIEIEVMRIENQNSYF